MNISKQERDLTFEFVKSGNAIGKMVVCEKGDVAEELPAVRLYSYFRTRHKCPFPDISCTKTVQCREA